MAVKLNNLGDEVFSIAWMSGRAGMGGNEKANYFVGGAKDLNGINFGGCKSLHDTLDT